MAEPSRSPDPGVVPSDSLTVVAARCRAAQRDFSFFHIFIIKTVEPHNLTFNLRLGTPRARVPDTPARGGHRRWRAPLGPLRGGAGCGVSAFRIARASRGARPLVFQGRRVTDAPLLTGHHAANAGAMRMAMALWLPAARSSPRPRHGSRFDKVKNTVNDRRDLARDPHPGRGAGGARARRTWRGGGAPPRARGPRTRPRPSPTRRRSSYLRVRKDTATNGL